MSERALTATGELSPDARFQMDMRAVSAHLSDEEAKYLTRRVLDDHERQEAIEKYKALRKKKSDEMLPVLARDP